jgi:hypothetical protein
MSIPTIPYAAFACLVSGVLIFLARDWFARSMMEGLRGFRKDLSSERLRRICSAGLGTFGLVLSAAGVVIIIAAAR